MQIKPSKLESDRGKITGIGRVKIPKTSDFNYEIPLLSFVVIEKEDGSYISSCIHLQIDGYGKTIETARRDMLDNILFFLDRNFNNEDHKEHCWENLLDLFETNKDSGVLWDKYHAFQIMLAEWGHTTDLRYSQSALIEQLWRKIEELERKVSELEVKNKIKELEERMMNPEGLNARKSNKFIDTMRSMKELPIVEYVPIPKEAA